ncbi:LD23890p [Strongyloides ratti]|uniref:LD23890p n=1 Tax=Strongyloides ratti TaxID=34506 RepID=A0A090LEE5_STRRB|nr:LD23890p [Strongyloides ratti]CEF66518.1 LD23890p [Strongyloides ratti]
MESLHFQNLSKKEIKPFLGLSYSSNYNHPTSVTHKKKEFSNLSRQNNKNKTKLEDRNRSIDSNRDNQKDMAIHSRRSSLLDPLLDEDHSMGKDRRKFLIVSVFDFCLTTVLWLLSTVSQGDSDWAKVFFDEINLFKPQFFEKSLFDVVFVAFLRMTFLLTTYAICWIRHWGPVALSTSITTIFIAIKVLFFFNKSNGSLPAYLVIVSTFIVAWFELWLMPFRVLNRERQAYYQSTQFGENDNNMGRIGGSNNLPNRVNHNSYITDDDAFGTARDVSSEEDEKAESIVQGSDTEDMKIEDYQYAVTVAEDKADKLWKQIHTWKVLSEGNIFISYSDENNSYYVKTTCDTNTFVLYQIVWMDQIKYNNQIKSTEKLLFVDECTEIVYSISAPAMLGHISSRDFLDVRRITYNREEDIFNGIFVSVKSAIKPPDTTGKLIRGENGVNLMRISKINDNCSLYEWIFNSNIKGKVPANLIKSGTKSFLMNTIKNLQKYVKNEAHTYLQKPI